MSDQPDIIPPALAANPAHAPAARPLLPYAFARNQGVLVMPDGETLAIRPDASAAAILEARRLAGQSLQPKPCSAEEHDRLLSECYALDGLSAAAEAAAQSSLSALVRESADLLDDSDSAPVIRLINALFQQAIEQGASDIHLEPAPDQTNADQPHGMCVRFRRDGIMEEILRLPAQIAPMLVSRVKVMAHLDIAEKRLPQDGRISLTLGRNMLDVRVSTLPARGGERVVMRILDQAAVALQLSELGLDAATHAALLDALQAPNGIILVTGPTGAGKTTSLYAALRILNDGQRNILTVEDPVEYAVPGIGQTQVDTRVGLTFAQGLRAILRQDPDVVMVGEIRDRETAEIAVQAALTGHLVLSTVHANSAAGAVTRLRDFGVESFLIAATLRAVVAQRLVRLVCHQCMTSEPLGEALAEHLGLSPDLPVARANGCSHCRGSGYVGRKGLFELLSIDRDMRALINDQAAESTLEDMGLARTLLQSARQAVISLQTTPTEVLSLFERERRKPVAQPDAAD